MQSSILNKRSPRIQSLFLLLAAGAFLTLTGCSSSRHTVSGPPAHVYYDFRDAGLAVDAPRAPIPDIITEAHTDVLGANKHDPFSVFRAAGAVVKESSATKARRRLRKAGGNVDVAQHVRHYILETAFSDLGMHGTEDLHQADYILEFFIDRHGLYAGPSFDGRLAFFLVADVELVSLETGERIWAQRFDIEEPLAENSLFSNFNSAQELASMSEEEMEDALTRISEYTADAILHQLRRDIYRSF